MSRLANQDGSLAIRNSKSAENDNDNENERVVCSEAMPRAASDYAVLSP